jgi:hypothetical protein
LEKEVRSCLLCEHVFSAVKGKVVVDCPKCLSRLPTLDDEEYADELLALARRVPELRKKREKSSKLAMASASRRRHGLKPLPRSASPAARDSAAFPARLKLPQLRGAYSSTSFGSTIG